MVCVDSGECLERAILFYVEENNKMRACLKEPRKSPENSDHPAKSQLQGGVSSPLLGMYVILLMSHRMCHVFRHT